MLQANPSLQPIEWVGQPLRRREDDALVRGAGCFVDDVTPDGCAYLEFVRSPVSAGRLTGLDLAAARAIPGVLAILTGDDVRGLPGLAVNPLIAPVAAPETPFLAHGRVEAVGQPVAAVIADTRWAAREAADLVAVSVLSEPPPTARPAAFSQRWDAGDVDAAFAAADHVVTVRVTHSRLAPTPLEPRAALVEMNEASGLTAWLATQTPHRARDELARILKLSRERVRVIAPDVGGAFGGKASIYPEDVVVALAALRLGRPVKWCSSRSEDFLSATQARGATSAGALALAADGRFLALRAEFQFPLGHWLPYSAVSPARNAARIVPGPYHIAAVAAESSGTVTNDAAMNIYRGAGRPEAAMLLERLADEAARTLRLDPLELRRRNLVPEDAFPHRTATGETLDSGDYETLLDRAAGLADYRALLAARDSRRAAGDVSGVGVALYVEPCGAGWESARVSLDEEGVIVAATGSSSQGQGRATAYAQIVADVLALRPEDIVVLHGDTATTPDGIGALASRSTAIGGAAMRKAAEAFRRQALASAAACLQTDEASIALDADGFLDRREPARRIGWRALAAAAPKRPEAVVRFEAAGEAWSSGCCIAAVAIARDTGETDD